MPFSWGGEGGRTLDVIGREAQMLRPQCIFGEYAKKRKARRIFGDVPRSSYSWSLSSPQQPLETEDPPTISQWRSNIHGLFFYGKLKV